jgi:hypothetical protein
MKVIEDVTMPVNTGRAFIVKKGQHIRVYATSTVDFVAFNLHNLRDRFDQARTKVMQQKIFISTGDQLLTKNNNPLFTIVEDTYEEGTHDLQKGMCHRKRWEIWWKEGKFHERYGRGPIRFEDLPDHGCWENLTEALKPWNIPPEDIPSPFNLFQTMEIDGKTGRMTYSKIKPKPGTYVDMRAEMDCLVAISACPEAGFARNPVRVMVYEE